MKNIADSVPSTSSFLAPTQNEDDYQLPDGYREKNYKRWSRNMLKNSTRQVCGFGSQRLDFSKHI